ncbi:MAG TPA: 6-carboxytetrahydropterin synthase [Terriglobales bacterium]|jgi:6-pyruvoyltetrahydropterin/6-carboxytetrahydropterin synthase|nr:6-carboxytetrahydropterin synthase [Terriglobales bacterium]
MKAHLTRRYRLAASHRLHSDALSTEENQRVYGKCNNPHGHGHNYIVEVTVSGQVDARTGMVCNLADLDQFMLREVVGRFDLTNLNCLPEFSPGIPTTEAFSECIFQIVQQGFPHARLEKIRIEETLMNSFEFAGANELQK